MRENKINEIADKLRKTCNQLGGEFTKEMKEGGAHVRAREHAELKCDAGKKGKIRIKGGGKIPDYEEPVENIRIENTSVETYARNDKINFDEEEGKPVIHVTKRAAGKHLATTTFELGEGDEEL